MPKDLNWEYDLEEYIRQGEPGRAEKSAVWQTAIGLQDVDGLKTSDYLIETAKDHIEGKIDITQPQLATLTGKSERTIKRRIADLREKGIIQRENGKRNGKWVIL